MSEIWHRAASAGDADDVWFCIREVYMSLLVCVSNRSDGSRRIVVDCTRVNGNLVAASPSMKISEHAVDQVVRSGCTCVVAVLNGVDGHLLDDVDVRVTAVPAVDPALNSTPATAVDELVKSHDASAEVAAWLSNRVRR